MVNYIHNSQYRVVSLNFDLAPSSGPDMVSISCACVLELKERTRNRSCSQYMEIKKCDYKRVDTKRPSHFIKISLKLTNPIKIT